MIGKNRISVISRRKTKKLIELSEVKLNQRSVLGLVTLGLKYLVQSLISFHLGIVLQVGGVHYYLQEHGVISDVGVVVQLR